MALVRQIEISPLEAIESGMAQFYTPQSSHETMLVRIPPHAIDDLFVHHFQTDQLLCVRGDFTLVVLQNRQYRYVPLSQEAPCIVRVPPGIPHGAINLSDRPCLLVNAVLRRGPVHPKDYTPIPPPFPYDLQQARTVLETCKRAVISERV